jgi:hypothetical protein
MIVGHALHLKFGLVHNHERQLLYKDWNLGHVLEIVQRSYVHISDNVLSRTLFGVHRVEWMQEHAPYLSHVVPLLVAVALVGSVWRPATQVSWKAGLLLAYSMLSTMIVMVVSRTDHRILHGKRYLYVQSLLAVLLLCVLTHWVVDMIWRKVATSSWFVGRTNPIPSWTLYAIPLTLAIGATSVDSAAYRDSRSGDNSERVSACIQRLVALEAEHGGPCGFVLTCKRPGDWPMRFRPPPCEE